MFDLPQIDRHEPSWAESNGPDDWHVSQVSMIQQTPLQVPRVAAEPSIGNSNTSNALSSSLFDSQSIDRSRLQQTNAVSSSTSQYVSGAEATQLAASDVGSLLGKDNRSSSVSVQKRNPIITDPRVRSSRVGSLAASGSHWVPARVDLDTVLSKFDSRQLNDAVIIPGPYSSLYGPGFQFVAFDLEHSPRFDGGTQLHSRSSGDFKSNGGQAFVQQSLLLGSDNWGMSATYGHRGGSDYLSGDNTRIPASYKSDDFRVACGRDMGDGRSIEFSMLQLQQRDIELPGYAFNIDDLGTQAYEVELTDRKSELADQSETAIWYNRTALNGTPARPSFLSFNPLFPQSTDVDSLSTGYRHGWIWKSGDGRAVTKAGQDFRFIKQELNEITFSLQLPNVPLNSPIPNSFSANPGVYLEHETLFTDGLTLRTGGRLDFAQTDIVADRSTLDTVGTLQNTYEAIVGTNQSQRDFFLASFHVGLDQSLSNEWNAVINAGYAERQPTLTELYAAQPFVQLVQNGLNDVTGDPTLAKEKLFQIDLGLNYQSEAVRGGLRGFHGWYFDYVTFENTHRNGGQVDLRAVNTDLATITGAESFLDLLPQEPLTPFMTLRYVDGRDRTRNGHFATVNADAFNPSTKDFTRVRGAESNTGGAASEPLPGISPFESRLGMRLHDTSIWQRWSIEVLARIDARQNRVASSLLETPTAGFTVYDLRCSWRPLSNRNILVVSGVENFTDKQYREHLDYRNMLTGAGVYQPGANFYLGTDFYY